MEIFYIIDISWWFLPFQNQYFHIDSFFSKISRSRLSRRDKKTPPRWRNWYLFTIDISKIFQSHATLDIMSIKIRVSISSSRYLKLHKNSGARRQWVRINFEEISDFCMLLLYDFSCKRKFHAYTRSHVYACPLITGKFSHDVIHLCQRITSFGDREKSAAIVTGSDIRNCN